jgi:hypothetical protein
MSNSPWKVLVKLYKKSFGVPEEVLSVMAVRAILLLCASGLSNESISIFLETDRKIVDNYIKDVFKFDGWGADLRYNPLYYEKNGLKCYNSKESEVCTIYNALYSKIEPYYK